MAPVSLPDEVRAACAWVADEDLNPGVDRESRAAFVCLNAINFGSGWWPTVRKRPGHSGFFTVAGGGALSAPPLAGPR